MADNFPDNPNNAREPYGYVCPKCRKETIYRYKQYCGDCGQKMPSQLRMQAMGQVTYPRDYGRPIRDHEQINNFLLGLGANKYWLADYHATFRTTEIRFGDAPTRSDTHALICSGTRRLRLPTSWTGVLQLLGNCETDYRLVDNQSDVEVWAGSILLHTVNDSVHFLWY